MSLPLPMLEVMVLNTRPRQLLISTAHGLFTCLAIMSLPLPMLEVVALNTRPRQLLISTAHGLFTYLVIMSLPLPMLEVVALNMRLRQLFTCLATMSLPLGDRSRLSHGLGPITSPLLDHVMPLSLTILSQFMMSPCLIATTT